MPNNIFYPSLTDILPTDQLPSSLGQFQNSLNSIFADLYYRNLQRDRSHGGDAAFFKLDIITYNKVGVDIPGTEFALLLNPDLIQGSGVGSSFPVSLHYKLDILKYAKEFEVASFNGDPVSFFLVLLEIVDVDTDEFLSELINVFFATVNPIQDFITTFNTNRPSNPLTAISDPDPQVVISDLADQIQNFNLDIFDTLYNDIISLGNINTIFDNLKKLFAQWLDEFDFENVKKLIEPEFSISLDNLSLGVQFPSSIFREVDPITLVPLVDIQTGGDVATILRFDVGRLSFSTETGFEFDLAGNFIFPTSEILRTGFTLSLTNLKVDLSRTKNIPEAILDNRPDDFIGVYVQDGEVTFPAFWQHDPGGSTARLKVHNLLVGTGGLSGTISLEATVLNDPAPIISVKFGQKFKVSLTAFDLTFHQNAITESNIFGRLEIPANDGSGSPAAPIVIDVKIHIGQDGEFYVTAINTSNTPIPLSHIANIYLHEVTIGRHDQRFFLEAAGSLNFQTQTGFIGSSLPEAIDIQKIIIWDDGETEIQGGNIELRKPIVLPIGPAKITITALGFGAYEGMHQGILRKYKYFEFSGGVSIKPGGVDARGDGIKLFFTVDNDPPNYKTTHFFLRINSLAIDLIIPGNVSADKATLLLNGYLSMKEPSGSGSDAGTEYAGSIDFKLPKLKMGGSAAMKYNPKVPSFLIDVSLELSTPIVLGATGLGIYGFRALFGKQYVVSKIEPPISLPPDAEWWQYYKKKVNPEQKEGVTISKMANLPGFSFGAGVSLATAADGGKAFSSKLFFLLSLPEVFLLEGQAQILKSRIGLDTTVDPPFFAIIAIDPNSISAGLGVNFKIPDDGPKIGSIATVDGVIEMAYFFHDSSAWYLNIGRDQPVDRRIQARIHDLFNVYFYFMLSGQGLRTGAGASFEKRIKIGPIKIHLAAYLDAAAKISKKPKQLGGSIDIGGSVEVTICGKGFSLTAAASLAAETPKPFIVTGSVEVCVKILKKEHCINLDFTWTFESLLDFQEIPTITDVVAIQSSIPTINSNLQSAIKALNIMSQETFNVLCIDNINPNNSNTASTIPPLTNQIWNSLDNYLLPMDSYIDIEFRKPVNPTGDISLDHFGGVSPGAHFTDYVAPQQGKSHRVRHDYVLNKLEIFNWDTTSNAWVPYHVYNAITPLNGAPFNLTSTQLNNLKFGYWQIDRPSYYTKVRLMAQTAVSFLSQGSGDVIPEELGVTNDALFCPGDPIGKTCVNFNAVAVQIPGPDSIFTKDTIRFYQGLLFRVMNHDGVIVNQPYAGFSNGLSIQDQDTLEVYFPEPMANVSMLIKTTTDSITLKYYRRTRSANRTSSNTPIFFYSLVGTETKIPSQLAGGLLYENLQQPIDKIEITAGVCKPIAGTGLVCDAGVSQEALDFQHLMDILAQNHDVAHDIHLLTDSNYGQSVVYPSSILPSKNTTALLYHPIATTTTLDITLSDLGYNCPIHLQVSVAGTTMDWSQILHFQNIRPDYSSPSLGNNFAFLIDVVVIVAGVMTTVTLKGTTTCFSVFSCYDKCNTLLYQTCYLNVSDYQFNQTIPSQTTVSQNNSLMMDAINKALLPLWRPDTNFAVRLQYDDKVYEESSVNSINSRAIVFGFRTNGPIGHFHEYPTGNASSIQLPGYSTLLAADHEDQYKLASLKHYIDYAKSYPNADGNIINAKPLYFQNPELLLFYVFPYVFEFYSNWASYNGTAPVDSSLEVLIKDPIEPATSTATPALNTWALNSAPAHQTPDVVAINNMIQNGNALSIACVPSTTVPATPNSVNNSVTPATPLEPLKLYTAIYNAVYRSSIMTVSQKREVHRYGFQTSRFPDFISHINSYKLLVDAITNAILTPAVYNISKVFAPALIAKAQQVLTGTLSNSDILHQEAAIPFDKLIDRIFELKELEPAENLQFNLIINTTTNNILGILLRSPEPFNDPKTPFVDLEDTIQMEVDPSGTGNSYGPTSDFMVLFSKDKANALITNSDFSMNVPAGIHRFTFRYKLFNGQAYAVKNPATDFVQVELSFGSSTFNNNL